MWGSITPTTRPARSPSTPSGLTRIPLHEPAGQRALIKMAEQIVPPSLQRLVARYRTIQQPALVIWGAEDPVVPPSLGKKLAHDLANGHFEVLKDCGHVPQEEMPKETLALVSAFLN